MKRPALTAQQRAQLESCIKTTQGIREDIEAADAAVVTAQQKVEAVRAEHQAAAEKAKGGSQDQVVKLMVVERRIGFADQELSGAQKRREEVRRSAGGRLSAVSRDLGQVYSDHRAAVKAAAEQVLSELFSDSTMISNLADQSDPVSQASQEVLIASSCVSALFRAEDPLDDCALMETSIGKLIGNSVGPARG